jgi:hypothetical protein
MILPPCLWETGRESQTLRWVFRALLLSDGRLRHWLGTPMSDCVHSNRWKARCLLGYSCARIYISTEMGNRLCLATSVAAFKLTDGAEEEKVTLLQ